MKTFLVMVLLGAAMFMLLVSMDLLMHYPLSDILQKELRPFRVTEGTEFIFYILFGIYFVSKAVIGIVKKKGQNNPN